MTGRRAVRSSANVLGAASVFGLVVVGVLAAPGLVVAVLPLALLAGAAACGVQRDQFMGWAGVLPRPRLYLALLVAELVMAGALCLGGLVVLSGQAAPSILASVLLGAVARWRMHSFAGSGWWGSDEGAAGQQHSPLQLMSSVQLRRSWRASYLRLSRCPRTEARERIAAARRELLAEFERRDPTGFARFLGSASPATRYPRRFCRGARDRAKSPR
ncbi:MAG: hypothetical protein H0V92_10195 [Pseudonocardiales bacterium]|nr:hypothetical protein [Pseudonocardiales bacterium]